MSNDFSPQTTRPAHFGQRRFFSWTDWQRQYYGGRVQKVSLDAGMTCPNRDGKVAVGGCTFCNNSGFTPSYLREHPDIPGQLATGLDFLQRRYPETKRYVAYFQAYSNTYAELPRLKELYETALAHPLISGLVIGTRPDCVPDEVLDYLGELAQKYIIELELGIESTDDATLARVNRGHDFACAVDAVERAAQRGLQIAAHVLFDLPGETRENMLTTATQLSALPLTSIKCHQLQIIRGTKLANDWRRDPNSIPLMSADAYMTLLADFLERLSPKIAIQRLGSEVPPSVKLAPEWNMRLAEITPRLEAVLAERDSWQGKYAHLD